MLFASTMQWKPYRMHNLGESNFALRAKILFLSRVFLEEELWYNWRPRKYIHLGERICLVTPQNRTGPSPQDQDRVDLTFAQHHLDKLICLSVRWLNTFWVSAECPT